MVESPRDPVRAALAPLIHGRGWIRALAGLNFVLGALLALTILGGLLGAFFAWVGAVLWQSARALDQAAQSPPQDDTHLVRAMERLAFHFFLQVGFLMVGVALVLLWHLVA